MDSYQAIIRTMRHGLTLDQIAKIAGVSTRTVQNWATGAGAPGGGQARDRLLQLGYVAAQLSDVYEDEGIQIWYNSPMRALSGETPVKALEAGRFDEVRALVDRLAGGSIVDVKPGAPASLGEGVTVDEAVVERV
jgi:transcriptional regulator with XRE-family HTH domain